MRSVDLEVGGETKRLRYDFNALADIEEKAGVGAAVLFSEQRMGFNAIRLLVWGGLRHQDPGLTTQRAGMVVKDFIDEGGTFEGLVGKIMEAIDLSGLLPKETKEENPTEPEKSGLQTKSEKLKKSEQPSD